MSQLISAHDLSHSFAGRQLFSGLSLGVFESDRIGLVGPNGAGKSTLMKILNLEIKPDQGKVVYRKGLRVGHLEQDPQFPAGQFIYDAILSKAHDPYELAGEAGTWMSKLGLDQFPSETTVQELSGGWRKRVALGRELVLNPDLLLLDEPTNHLDVDSILWLETFIAETSVATITVTHDRLFLQRVANKIFDLDRKNPQGLLVVDGDYLKYTEAKELLMAGQKHQEWTLKNTLRRETEWLRRGAKARQTKQKSRIDRAHDLKEQVQDLNTRNQNKKVQIDFADNERSPKKLIEILAVNKSYGSRKIISDFSFLITPKTRLGLLGPNGAGKTTLIKCLLGTERVDSGKINLAENLKVSYFEQNRQTLNPELSVLKNICPEGDYVHFQGQYVHVRTYLEKFLFSALQSNQPVSKLSGGEQSRLRIAQMMLQTASVLILDEPTNDLDFETLAVLETALQEFNGAVILVTHDRYFMDQVCSEILAFSSEGKLERFADYLQWEAWRDSNIEIEIEKEREFKKAQAASPSKSKLTYKEKIEFEKMEGLISQLENEILNWESQLQIPENMSNSTELQKLSKQISENQKRIETLYERWTELEKKAK